MKTMFTKFKSLFSRNKSIFFVLIIIAFSNIITAQAETADSIFTTLQQVVTKYPTDTFKVSDKRGYLYNRAIVSKEVEVRIYFAENPLFISSNNAFFLIMKDFKGPGTYTLENYGGNESLYSTWYGNSDIGTLEGTVIVEEYDSLAKYIKGSFSVRVSSAWKTSSGQNSKGTFRFGFNNSISVLPSKKFDLEIGKSQKLDITVLASNLAVADADIYITDTTQSVNVEKLIGKTNASGKISYVILSDKVTKEKLSTIKIRAVKDGKEISKCDVVVNLKLPSTCYNVMKNGEVVFSICTVGLDKWETTEGEPTLKSPLGVIFNNFLHFVGPITIDTVALSIKGSVELLIKDIPLPLGKKGTLSLGKANYDFALLGESGLLTLVTSTGKDKGCKLFEGYEVDITDIKLLGGRNAHGVALSATIKIDGLAKTCSTFGGDKAEFSVDSLVFSSIDGTNLKGLKIKELGLGYPGFCLREFVFLYEKNEDKLTIGAKISLPIAEIGGGFQLKKGVLDSIGWMLEAKYPPLVVFAPTTIGMSGFYGMIEGMAKTEDKPFGVKLGGILCDAVVPIAYSFKVYGQYIQPSFLELGAEDISIFKTGSFWQVVGAGSVSADLKKYMFKIKAELKVGSMDGEVYYFKGNGLLAYSKKTEQGTLAGQLTGDLTIPALSETKVQRWMSKKMGLPYTASAYARFSDRTGKIISGEIYFGKEYGSVLYSLNFDKNQFDPDFLFLNIPALNNLFGEAYKKDNGIQENSKTIPVPKDTKFGLLIRSDSVKIESSTIIDPDGITYKYDVNNPNITYNLSADLKEEYWTLLNPKVGDWKIKYTPKTKKDTLDVYVKPVENKNTFAITATQIAKNINIIWDKTNLKQSDSIDVYFGTNATDMNGEFIGTFPASKGSTTIVLDSNYTFCNFYVLANLIQNNIIYPAYSNTLFTNPRAKLAPPLGIKANYNSTLNHLSLSWIPSTDPAVIGYIVKISDTKGLDSILTTVFKSQNSAEFDIKADGKIIQMTSFTEKGESGCPGFVTVLSSIDENYTGNIEASLRLYPNPANDILNIYINSDKGQISNIQLYNLLGENLVDLDLLNSSNSNKIRQIDISNFSSGVYYLKYNLNQQTYSVSVNIIK
ncbi:MAG: T9SS type A sorting domain-containing protein [Candidatus Kapabacteria bacterium]|nr:T9SS type A sorting domain-containing protein [Candidatus Kapabacteria bacterium]